MSDTASVWQRTTCPHDCPSACALEVDIAENRLQRVRGSRQQRYTDGVICAKVARYADRVHHPDRLLRPLRRAGAKGTGKFVPISWDDALDEVASRLLETAVQHGAEAVWPYHYAGTMGLLQRNAINGLRHVMGYSRQLATICSTASRAGWRAGVGAEWGSDPSEMAESDLLVIWGCNAVATQINAMHWVGKGQRRGAKLVVVDPYRTQTAAKADLHLMLKPGTDGALAAAVMHCLLRDQKVDEAYLARATDFDAQVASHLQACTPQWAAAITGVSVAEIELFATLYGAHRKSYIRIGLGMARQRNGSVNLHAVSCLPALTGAWQHRGGGALAFTSGLFHMNLGLIEAHDCIDRGVRELDMSQLGPVLAGERDALRGGGPVRAMVVQSCNPALVTPELGKVRKGLVSESLFLCVHEQFMTETAQLADIVLPATMFLEHDDLYTSYGQTFLQAGPALLPPPGECRDNFSVLRELAQRLGADHPLFELDGKIVLDATLTQSGYPTYAELCEHGPLDCTKPFAEMHFQHGFGHPDGRFRFAPDWPALGAAGESMPSLPGHWPVIEQADTEHPFRLVTAPAHNFLNSTFSETGRAQSAEGEPHLMLHPDDAARLGVADGELVRVGNRRGSVVLAARHFPGVAPGVVIHEGIWPGAAFAEGQGINVLVGSDAIAPAGGAAFHDTSVWVCAAASA